MGRQSIAVIVESIPKIEVPYLGADLNVPEGKRQKMLAFPSWRKVEYVMRTCSYGITERREYGKAQSRKDARSHWSDG